MRTVGGRKLPIALPADSAFLRAALKDAFDAVVITSEDLDPPGPAILFVNRALEEMTGYRCAEVLGRTPRLLQGPATDRRALAALRRSLVEGGSFPAKSSTTARTAEPSGSNGGSARCVPRKAVSATGFPSSAT